MKTKYILLLLIVTCLSFTNPNIKVSAEEQIKEIDIETSPHTTLFSMMNLKPGDELTKTLNIINRGKKDFNYLVTNNFLSGSNKYYNELLLEVIDSKKTLFKGKLKDFNRLDSRTLKSGTSEKLTFRVEIPYELDNKYQGLSSEFQLKVYVEGTLGGILPVDGPKLPETGTNMFNILVAGAVLIITGSIIQFSMIKRRSRIERRV